MKKNIRYTAPQFLSALRLNQKTHLTPFAPVAINALVRAFGSSSPNESERLLQDHSPFPLFRPVLTQAEATALEARLLTGDLRAKLSQFTKADHSVKFCPECADTDKKPYLRRKHQLKGYSACLTHKIHLIEIQIPYEPNEFYIDLDRTISRSASNKVPAAEVELDLARRIESLTGDHGVTLTDILYDSSQRYRNIERSFNNSKRFDDFYEIISGESKTFSLKGHWIPKSTVKRLTTRLFRIAAIQLYCDAPLLTQAFERAPSRPTSANFRQIAHSPAITPKGMFPCRNPTCIDFRKNKAFAKERGLNLTKWNFVCSTCGFAYEAAIHKGKTRQHAFREPGPHLSSLLISLWPNQSWTAIKKKTRLSEVPLLVAAKKLGLPFEGRPPKIIKKLVDKRRGEARPDGHIEASKLKLLEFFATNPSYKDLKAHKYLNICFRKLRHREPAWLLEAMPVSFRAHVREHTRRQREPMVDVDQTNS